MEETNSIIDWCETNWEKDSITAPPMDDKTALKFLFDYLVPNDYCIPYSCSSEQANTELVCYVIKEYSTKYKKEFKLNEKKKKLERKYNHKVNKIVNYYRYKR